MSARVKKLAQFTTKLRAQKAFVDWWDKQAKKDKGGGNVTRNRSVTSEGTDNLGTFALDRMTVSRWRKKLADFDEAFKEAKHWAIKNIEFASADAEAP